MPDISTAAIEKALIADDLSKLTPEDRVEYYNSTCESLGLNPLTQPFAYINLNGKLRLYARKDATDQLRKIYGVSVSNLQHDFRENVGLYVVTASGHDKTGRADVSTGAVNVKGQSGETLANSIMKAESKAKRRFTLSLCGLGMLDETELETVQPQQPMSAAPKAPTVPKVDHSPAIATDAPRPGADRTLVEVILDKPVAPVEIQKMDGPVMLLPDGSVLKMNGQTLETTITPPPEKAKKLTAKQKADQALDEEHSAMMKQIDGEIAKNNDPDARLPTPEERTENSARIRALIALGMSASEKSNLQKYVEAGKPLVEKLQSDWKAVLTQLEAAGTKEAVLNLIAVQPESEEF